MGWGGWLRIQPSTFQSFHSPASTKKLSHAVTSQRNGGNCDGHGIKGDLVVVVASISNAVLLRLQQPKAKPPLRRQMERRTTEQLVGTRYSRRLRLFMVLGLFVSQRFYFIQFRELLKQSCSTTADYRSLQSLKSLRLLWDPRWVITPSEILETICALGPKGRAMYLAMTPECFLFSDFFVSLLL